MKKLYTVAFLLAMSSTLAFAGGHGGHDGHGMNKMSAASAGSGVHFYGRIYLGYEKG